jgi:hypothetical protein
VSYGEVVVPRFESAGAHPKPDENCAILLYGHRHPSDPASWRGDGVRFRFVGVVSYRP